MESDAITKSIESGDFNILLLVGAIAIIQFLLSLWIGERTKNSIKHEYATSLEDHKSELIKRKLIYEAQINAYKDFCSILYKIYPDLTFKEMDYGDAVESVAESFSHHAKAIDCYLQTHSAILPKAIREKVEDCSHFCAIGKLEVTAEGVSSSGMDYADKLLKASEAVDKQFREYLEIDKEIKS